MNYMVMVRGTQLTINLLIYWMFADLKSRRNLSFSEDSDLSCDDVLERSSQKSKADVSSNRCSRDASHICHQVFTPARVDSAHLRRFSLQSIC